MRLLSNVGETVQQRADNELKFLLLAMMSMRLAVLYNTAFSSRKNLTVPLGSLLTLTVSNLNGGILLYNSIKYERATRIIFAAEHFVAVNSFDFDSIMRFTLNDIIDIIVPSVLYTDSKSLFD